MRKHEIKVVLHAGNSSEKAIQDRVNKFHAEIIERRLRESGLTAYEVSSVIDGIIERTKRH